MAVVVVMVNIISHCYKVSITRGMTIGFEFSLGTPDLPQNKCLFF